MVPWQRCKRASSHGWGNDIDCPGMERAALVRTAPVQTFQLKVLRRSRMAAPFELFRAGR